MLRLASLAKAEVSNPTSVLGFRVQARTHASLLQKGLGFRAGVLAVIKSGCTKGLGCRVQGPAGAVSTVAAVNRNARAS